MFNLPLKTSINFVFSRLLLLSLFTVLAYHPLRADVQRAAPNRFTEASTQLKRWSDALEHAPARVFEKGRHWAQSKSASNDDDALLNQLSLVFGVVALGLLGVGLLLSDSIGGMIILAGEAFAIAGLILGIIGVRRNKPERRMGVLGIIFSSIAIAALVLFFVLLFIYLIFFF